MEISDENKLETRLTDLKTDIESTALSLQNHGASETALVALLSMHQYISDIAKWADLSPSSPEFTQFMTAMQEGVRRLRDGLTTGNSTAELQKNMGTKAEGFRDGIAEVLRTLNAGIQIGNEETRSVQEHQL